jgi:hypothetical protein
METLKTEGVGRGKPEVTGLPELKTLKGRRTPGELAAGSPGAVRFG